MRKWKKKGSFMIVGVIIISIIALTIKGGEIKVPKINQTRLSEVKLKKTKEAFKAKETTQQEIKKDKAVKTTVKLESNLKIKKSNIDKYNKELLKNENFYVLLKNEGGEFVPKEITETDLIELERNSKDTKFSISQMKYQGRVYTIIKNR
ncbi:hypothetical protein ACFO26_01665 [Lactococcus nasutitermitis]|uniref:Uncharacterized protein n=1 Tax=Lactococcus nasutitermitis TaxID=1652957 RepID=A0ABV9JA64_9LACT|nr:hypothetical protein [Lactococcus nasutitermitis]